MRSLVILFLAVALLAQSDSARITGRVVDVWDAPVPYAIVTLRLTGSGRIAAQTSVLSDGTFAFARVESDTYDIAFESPGAKLSVLQGIKIKSGASLHLGEVILEFGGDPVDVKLLSDTSNMYCIERLPLPDYPLAARRDRVAGTVRASVRLSARLSVEQIDTKLTSKSERAGSVFVEVVEQAIRRASFRAGCGGATFLLTFEFEFQERRSDTRSSPSASYGFPNRFWIVADPPSAQRGPAESRRD